MSRQQRLLVLWALVVFGLAIRAFAGGLLPPSEQVLRQPWTVDVNWASVAELQVLPGVGPSRAEQIVLERIRGGPFRSAADLQRVPGLGPELVRAMAPFLAVRVRQTVGRR